MRKRLTKMTLEQTAPARGRVEVRDTDSPLVFRLTSKDARSLSIRTRLRAQQIRLTYPGSATIDNLDDARRWAHEVAAQCRQGIDPREEERRLLLEAEMAGGRRFDQVVNQFIERYAKKNKTWSETRAIFNRHVLPRWRERQLDEINRSDVASLLDEVEDKSSVYSANRVLAAVRKLFNWSVTRGLIERSPVVPGMARKGEVSRTRYLSADELRLVWNAADKLGITPHIVGSVLNHDPKSYKGITSAYTRGDLIYERRKALTPGRAFFPSSSMKPDGREFPSCSAPKQKRKLHARMSSVA